MYERPLTEGAKRALDYAARLSRQMASAQIEPRHLLAGLLDQENHAWTVLTSCGFGFDELELLFPDGLPETEPEALDSGEFALRPRSPDLSKLLQEARRSAGLEGRDAEVGSEHLLWALLAVDSPAARLLRKQGVDLRSIEAQTSGTLDAGSEPLEVDIRLEPQTTSEREHFDTLRIIDAAANRAREGLRVVEDYLRFTLDDAHLTALTKSTRHALTAALGGIQADTLIAARDTQRDVGTKVSTKAESRRSSSQNVAQANLKRAQEALRTLEEFGKLISPQLGTDMESIRYQLYTLEKAIVTTIGACLSFDGVDVYLLVTEDLCAGGWERTIREALRGGAGAVQLREKSMTDRQLVEYGKAVRELTRKHNALFIMNDRPDLALLSDADGVHVGQDELSVRDVRRIVGPERIVGVSTHTIQQVRQAVLDGADYIGVGPVFPSSTKQFDEFAGLEFVRQTADEISLPWFAIGGIAADNIDRVLSAGAKRVAVSGAICGANEPWPAAAELLQRIREK